jgi:hypothetical protein
MTQIINKRDWEDQVDRRHLLSFHLFTFMEDDKTEHPHDHPMNSVTMLLSWRGYYEEINGKLRHRIPLFPYFRRSGTPHKIILPRDDEERPVRTVAFIIGFGDTREWGFHTEKGWVLSEDYLQYPFKGQDEKS